MKLKILAMPLTLLLLNACGKEAATGTTLSTTLAGVMSAASTQLAAGIPGTASTLLQSRNFRPFGDLSETNYNSADITIFQSSYFTSPKTALAYVLNKAEDVDPTDGMGLVARFKQKIVSGMCPIMALHPDADNNGIPDVGSGTITLPDFTDTSNAVVASVVSKCEGLNLDSLENASGRTIGYAVTDVSAEAGSLYSIRGTIDFGNDDSDDNIFYFKADGSVSRFAFAETGESGGAFVLFEYDGTNVKFDNHSGGNDGHYRMLYNTSTKDVTLYSWLANESNLATKNLYMGISGNRAKSVGAFTLTAVNEGSTVVDNGQVCVDLDSAAKTFSAAVVGSACEGSTVIDFATEPAVVSASETLVVTATNFTSAVKPLFSTRAEVFSKGIIE